MGSAVGETPVVEIDRVAQWYGLTPTEARLTVWLAGGKSLQVPRSAPSASTPRAPS